MFLDLIVLLLILMITGYLATQGMLSSLLALATSIFASILAMALLEPTQGIIRGWRPDYARGVTFLLLFFLVFGIIRFAADYAVPKNIKLKPLINRLAGGVIGFPTALVVVGSLLIGLEMLPIARDPLGFDRFPADAHMQAVDSDNRPLFGEVARPANVWFAPDRFVLTLWNAASKRSLGGARSWSSLHPDLSIESYGYRNHIDGSLRYLPPSLLKVMDSWISADAVLKDEQGADHKPDPGKRYVMVRTSVQKGGPAPNFSSDEDNYLRICASQVRLVTDKGRQYYPIGYLELGKSFVPLPLDVGFVVDDYVKGADAVDDWVFQVAEGETPAVIEIKQLARADLAGVLKDKPFPALAASAYPPHQYYKELCTLTVTFVPRAKEQLHFTGRVYVLKPEGVRRDVGSLLSSAYDHIIECDHAIANHTGGWDSAVKPGVPSLNQFSGAARYGQDIKAGNDATTVSWGQMLQLLLLGQAQPDGDLNLRQIPVYFDTDIVGAWKTTRKGNLVVGFANSDESGRVDVAKISAGRHPVVVTLLTDRGFFVWCKDTEFKASSHESIKAVGDSSGSGESPIFRVDLEEKAP